jgi:hypothetical protein
MRAADTYRGARRNAWHEYRQTFIPKKRPSWASGNVLSGPWLNKSRTLVAGHLLTAARSKYLPHESVKRGGTGPVFA